MQKNKLLRIFLIFLIIGCFVVFLIKYNDNEPFSSINWKENPQERANMVDDLLASNILIGKSRIEVIDILGKHGHVSRSDYNKNTMFAYHIGIKKSLIGPDIEQILIIEFKDDKILSVYKVSDEWYYDIE